MIKELVSIQSELKCDKGQYNSFGKYRYRSCEDILEAVKPLLKKYDCTLTLTDDILLVGERYYVRATASLMNKDGFETHTMALAREEDTKKGMDASQITGTASSYARKYALNGLFCIDDTKDADTDENHTEKESKKKTETKAGTWREKVIAESKARGIALTELMKDYKLDKNTTEERFKEVYEDLVQIKMELSNEGNA